jgi:hypothetical protein
MRSLPLFLAAICATACVQTVEVSRTIQPSRPLRDRSSERAGVVCSENLLAHVAREGGYKLELGEPLCAALFRSVEGSYRAAERTAKPPYKGEYSRVVRFDLQSSAIGIQRLRDSTRVTCSISVVVERFGRDLKRVSSQSVVGNGSVERSDATDVLVKEAVEAALQQVTDNASSLLVAGLDGPRVPAAPQR